MLYANKKCPFTNSNTLPFNALAYTECNKTDCRFQINERCIILEKHETLNRLEKKLDSILAKR